VVSFNAFVDFFAITMTLAALVAHTFTALRVLTLTLAALAVVSLNAFAEFFVILVTLAALIANMLAVLRVLALFPIPLLDFRNTAIHARGARRRLERGRWRRCQCECPHGKGGTKTYRRNRSHKNAFSYCFTQAHEFRNNLAFVRCVSSSAFRSGGHTGKWLPRFAPATLCMRLPWTPLLGD